MIATAIKIARETPTHKFERGLAARFVVIGNGWGLKFYSWKDVRNQTYVLQKRAAKHGLAPQIGSKLTFKMNGYTYYGYLTECVAVVGETFKATHGIEGNFYDFIDNLSEDDRNDLENMEEECKQELKEKPEYQNLIFWMKKKGFKTWDMHWNNVGYLPDGTFVAIDFDNC